MITTLEIALAGLLLWVLLSALLAPLESLGWWAGWFGERAEEAETAPASAQESARSTAGADGPVKPFVVFLTGIAGVRQELHLPEEQYLLRRLRAQLPDAVLVDDIFPYSVTNRALTGQRVFAWFWRYALRSKEKGGRIGFVINIRNLFQVLVSADRRYGPIYNRGTAQLVWDGLRRHGYPLGSGTPVFFIGYSGGSQISVGAAPYLKEHLNAPVIIISLAGIVCSDPGLLEVDHLYHLRGEKDNVERLGFFLAPGRWSLLRNSYWNQALDQKKISILNMGPMCHNGLGSYLDSQSHLNDQQNYLDKTVEIIVQLIHQNVPPNN